MSIDQDFEAECMRAELLGLPKPDKDTYTINKVSPSTLCSDDEDEETRAIDNRFLEEINLDGENIQQAAGGLDELNSILAITQKKINNFKVLEISRNTFPEELSEQSKKIIALEAKNELLEKQLQQQTNLTIEAEKKVERLSGEKSACGNLTNLLKVRIRGSEPNSVDPSPCPSPAPTKKFDNNSSAATSPDGADQPVIQQESDEGNPRSVAQKRMDFDREVSNQVDKLDAMLNKADNAVYSMSAQNKQMKKYLQ